MPYRLCTASVPHLYCRCSEELYLYIGASIGYWRGDIKGLMDDIGGWEGRGRREGRAGLPVQLRAVGGRQRGAGRQAARSCARHCTHLPACIVGVGPLCLLCAAGALRPTLFCGVPRVFDRIYAGVMQKVGLQQQP